MNLIDQFEFCVAVLGLRLLEDNGLEVVREFVKRKSRTKVIIHTDNATFTSAQHGIDFGIFSSVEKAKGLAHLIEQVQRASAVYLVESRSYAQRVAIIGEMANALAHEINQPLAAISNFTGGMLLGLKNSNYSVEELINILKQVQSQTIRAGEIVGRLRSYGFRARPNLAELDVNEVVIEATRLVDFDIRDQRVSMKLMLEESPLMVKGDRVQIIQVLVNILKNAVKAVASVDTKNRKCYVRTKLSGSDVQIEIGDDGPGVASERIPLLLEPNYSTKEGGMGFGLRICKSIMEDHSGSIVLERREPSGIVVHLRLPRVRQ